MRIVLSLFRRFCRLSQRWPTRGGDSGWLGGFADVVEDLRLAAGIVDEGDNPHRGAADWATQGQGFIDARQKYRLQAIVQWSEGLMMKAILTGHTRGLGAAIAADLLSRNIAILGLSRNRNDALAHRFPEMLQEVEIDLADSAALAHWLAGGTVQDFVADCKNVLLINNAGIVQPVGPIDTQDVRTTAQAIALNVAAPLMLAAAVTAASRDATDTRILHVSSGAGRNAYPGWSIYCATKAALDHHARSVVLDQTSNLRICSLAPGVIDTDMQAQIRATSLEQFPLRERFEGLKRDGQLADAADCAAQMLDFLLGARFGQVPVADLREVGN